MVEKKKTFSVERVFVLSRSMSELFMRLNK